MTADGKGMLANFLGLLDGRLRHQGGDLAGGRRRDLVERRDRRRFGAIGDGQATPAQIGGLLIALRIKGETADEIVGAARAMWARALPLVCLSPERGVDTCGTGGDGSGTVNVSTTPRSSPPGAGCGG